MIIIALTGLISVVLPVAIFYLFEKHTNWDGLKTEPDESLDDDTEE
jgi:hypothetical protein